MLHTQLAALALAATALAASGCGSSKTSSSASSSAAATPPATTATATTPAAGQPLTRAVLIEKGDAICARANTKTSIMTVTSIKDFTRVYPQVAIYNRTEATELGKLVPPSSLAHDWAQMINDLNLHSRYANEVARDIEQKSAKAGRNFELANNALSQLIETGKRDGFAHCSKLS